MDTNLIHTGDCFDVLGDLPDESIHACVTDPPYGLNFMPSVTNGWDDFEPKEYQEWCEEWARSVMRVLKPGGHLLAFSGNRTHHRAFTGIEDAGFEIRDTITWHYGSGFPKASDVSKTIDKRADADRDVIAEREADDIRGGEFRNEHSDTTTYQYTAPETDAAKQWDGWKTALKPATEYVVVARKPFDGATVDCVLDHGTGALNIEECRVGTSTRGNPPQGTADGVDYGTKVYDGGTVKGRYPSNVVFDEHAAADLDKQTGDTSGGDTRGVCNGDRPGGFADVGADSGEGEPNARVYEDSGGPSRYFYTSKASRAERTLNGQIENAHPTVKPQDLMEWLIKLVTRENQIVLDPFTGSGTTCKSAKELSRRFIGIEKQAKWADVARVRCGLTPDDPGTVRDDSQAGYEEFV